jgi:DNA-binding winged helix-turn-helix (wHTH) protein
MSSPARLIHEFGTYRLDMTGYRLFHEGEEIELQKRLMDFLIVLVRHPDQLLTYRQLLDAVWGETTVEENNISVSVKKLRKVLGEHYIQTVQGRGYRFKAQVRIVEDAENAGSTSSIAVPSRDRPPVNALSPDSPFYVRRETDDEFYSAIARADVLVHVKGAREVGKSSLLAQGMQYASKLGRTVVLTDFGSLNSDAFASIDNLLYALAERIATRFTIDFPPRSWKSSISPNTNFENYLRLEVLPRIENKLLWCLDKVDRLLNCAYKDDFFGLLRYWHNFPWAPFTIVLAYGTEAHLFITNLNQSPFNVGTRLSLEDFTPAQLTELDRRYDSPLRGAVAPYYKLLGGHPFLTHFGLYKMVHGKLDMHALETQADRNDGPFGDHLYRLFETLVQDNDLARAVRTVLQKETGLASSDFYRLRSAGILTGESPHDAKLRCELYSMYLRKHLL